MQMRLDWLQGPNNFHVQNYLCVDTFVSFMHLGRKPHSANAEVQKN